MDPQELAEEERRLEVTNPALLAVPPHLRPQRDFYGTLPASLLGWANALGEALKPAFPQAAAPLLGVSVIYVGFTTFERHRIATQFQIVPERRATAGRRVGFDNLLREWLACMTVPPLVVAAAAAGANRAVAASAGRIAGRAAQLAPVLAGVAVTPLAMRAGYFVSDAVMDWAVRPLLNDMIPLPVRRINTAAGAGAAAAAGSGSGSAVGVGVDGPRAGYTTPDSADLLKEAGGASGAAARALEAARAGATAPTPLDGTTAAAPAGASSPAASGTGTSTGIDDIPEGADLLGLIDMVSVDLDPLARRQLAWALDGDPESPYPGLEEQMKHAQQPPAA